MNTQAKQENNAPQINENAPIPNDDVLSFGLEAVKDWQRGTKALGTGDQRAIYALAHAWEEVTFLAVINDRKGNFERQFDFDLEEYVTKQCLNADGTRDNKATNARTVAITKRVFGIDEPDQSIKQRISRALEVVAFIMGQGYSATDLEISKSGRISVPYTCLNDEPDTEKASKNELKTWEAMKGETVELDGKKGHTIAELQRRAKPKPDRHATAQTSNKGAEFLASVKFVDTVLANLLDEKAKSEMPAPNKEMRKHLFDLSSRLVAYFEADPMDKEEEQGNQEKANGTNGRKNTRASKG